MHAFRTHFVRFAPFFVFVALLRFQAIHAADGLAVTPDEKAFFAAVKKAVLARDAAWLAARVTYPLRVELEKQRVTIRSKEEFVDTYDRLVTLKGANRIRKQSPDTLVKNEAGVMIGDGEFWFAPIPGDDGTGAPADRFRITAMNP